MPCYTDVQVLDGLADMFGRTRNHVLPYWGGPVTARPHLAWRVDGLTLELTYHDGFFTDHFSLVGESDKAFSDRQVDDRLLCALERDTRFKFEAKYRHDDVTSVYDLTVFNRHDSDWSSRTNYRPVSDVITHCLGTGFTAPWRPASEADTLLVVDRLCDDLPGDLLGVLLGEPLAVTG